MFDIDDILYSPVIPLSDDSSDNLYEIWYKLSSTSEFHSARKPGEYSSEEADRIVEEENNRIKFELRITIGMYYKKIVKQ